MTPQPQHCDHEMQICRLYQADPMRTDACTRTDCYADTRSRPSPSAPELPIATCNICDLARGCEINFGKNGYPPCVHRAIATIRNQMLDALERDFKGRYVEDAVAEIRRFPESLRREVME